MCLRRYLPESGYISTRGLGVVAFSKPHRNLSISTKITQVVALACDPLSITINLPLVTFQNHPIRLSFRDWKIDLDP